MQIADTLFITSDDHQLRFDSGLNKTQEEEDAWAGAAGGAHTRAYKLTH